MSKNKAYKLFEQVLKSIETVGIDKTIETLKITETKLLESNQIITEFIIKSVCECFGVPMKSIKSNRKGMSDVKTRNALKLCSHLIYTHTDYSQREIQYKIKLDHSQVSRYINEIPNLDINFEKDNYLKSKLDLIENEIVDFKTKILENNE